MKKLMQISSLCGFEPKELADKARRLREILEEKGIDDLPILIAFDINGPLISTEDATMTPYVGTIEVLQLLTNLPRVKLCLISGWDLTTVRQFSTKILGLDRISIVAERGMLYMDDGKIYHLYPNSEDEIDDFAITLFKVASGKNLQIAIQPNVSSGCQCIYFEGFNRAKLGEHPCMSGIEISSLALINILKKNHIKCLIDHNILTIFATAPILYRLLKEKLPLFPLRILDVDNLEDSKIYINIDPNDNTCYDLKMLVETAAIISNLTKRSYEANDDYSIDFLTNVAIDNGYSKSRAAHKLGHKLFGERFVIFNVGDKLGDIVDCDNAIFFPQNNTGAMSATSNIGFPVTDGREYALILAFYFELWIR